MDNASSFAVVGLRIFLASIFRISDWLTGWTWQEIVVTALIFVGTFVVATGIVSFVLVRLPAGYFHPDYDRQILKDRQPLVRWAAIIGKNLGGVILILVGIVLSLPGIPGPGIVTILFGIMLLDFPGKRRLEYKLVSQPRVLKAINQLRQRYGKAPLEL